MSVQDGIREVLESGDEAEITKMKAKWLNIVSENAKKFVEQGNTVSNVTASTFISNELELKKNKGDIVLQFKRDILLSFMKLNNMSMYRQSSDIKEGDSVVVKIGKYHLAYDVLEYAKPSTLLRSCFLKDDKLQMNEKEITIDNKNFVFGIRMDYAVPAINHKLFFFFYNNN